MKNNKNTKSTKSNIKSIVIKLCIAMIVGGILGAVLGFLHFIQLENSPSEFLEHLLTTIQNYIFPVLIITTVLAIALQEFFLAKLKKICAKLPDAEDEEFDQLDYEEERTGAILQSINVLSQVVCIVVLSFGYSFDYLANGSLIPLGSCIVFLICFFYDAMEQVRYIKLIQKTHPEKQGDVSSTKFQQQWLESCDEAEKEVIYQSAYKAFSRMNKLFGILLILTMFAHLMFHTGIFAIVVVGIIYLVQSLTYYKSCVVLKKVQLQR